MVLRRYLVPFKTHRLPHMLTDVLVIGSGVAGLRAALESATAGDVVLVTKHQLSESNSFYAQGGIATVMNPEDSFESHIQDTLVAGCGLGEMKVIESVVREAPFRIDELIRWGANFDREAGGNLSFTREGGHRYARILHALGDATGRELASCLSARVRATEAIQVQEYTFVIDLVTQENRCIGAIAWSETRGIFFIQARQTILASGGAGMLFRETTNPAVATADGHAMAYRAGVRMRDMEMVQFHPTTLYIAGATRTLVSEAVRGEGAKLIDKSGHRFMPQYHPSAELAPRDVVSRAIVEQMAKTQTTHVYLDARHMSEAAFQERFPGIYQMCLGFGVNPAMQVIPVHPSAHYMIGGAAVDLDGRCNIDNLWVVGEASYTGLHGANRLGSNSLIEALVFGYRAGARTAELISGEKPVRTVPRLESKISQSPRTEMDTQDIRSSLRSLMWRNVGIERVGPRLEESLEIIDFWSRYVLDKIFDSPATWELQNMLEVAALITRSALERCETRGVHFRTDHPRSLDATWRCHQDWTWPATTPKLTAPL